MKVYRVPLTIEDRDVDDPIPWEECAYVWADSESEALDYAAMNVRNRYHNENLLIDFGEPQEIIR